jgi:hypothetical protein
MCRIGVHVGCGKQPYPVGDAGGPDLGPVLIVAHAEHDDRLRP